MGKRIYNIIGFIFIIISLTRCDIAILCEYYLSNKSDSTLMIQFRAAKNMMDSSRRVDL